MKSLIQQERQTKQSCVLGVTIETTQEFPSYAKAGTWMWVKVGHVRLLSRVERFLKWLNTRPKKKNVWSLKERCQRHRGDEGAQGNIFPTLSLFQNCSTGFVLWKCLFSGPGTSRSQSLAIWRFYKQILKEENKFLWDINNSTTLVDAYITQWCNMVLKLIPKSYHAQIYWAYRHHEIFWIK